MTLNLIQLKAYKVSQIVITMGLSSGLDDDWKNIMVSQICIMFSRLSQLLSRPPSHLLSVLCKIYFFHSAWILNGIRLHLREVIITTSRLNDYISSKIVTGREQDRRENLNRRQSVLLRSQTSERSHKCHCTDDSRCDRRHSITLFERINF